jgi:hypothetical protein
MQLALTHGETRANDEHRAIAAARARARYEARLSARPRPHRRCRPIAARLSSRASTRDERPVGQSITTPASRVGTEPPRLQQFVGGAWVASSGDSWIDDRKPIGRE